MSALLDTEDRCDRALLALDGITGLVAAQPVDRHGFADLPISAANLSALLDMVSQELRAAIPVALNRRMGAIDEPE